MTIPIAPGGVTIMRDNVAIIRERQCGIRRQIDSRGIALKIVAADSGIPYETLLTYFPQPGSSREPAQIPGGAIYALCEGNALPADLLSLLLPDGWQIVRAPEAINHDQIEEACRDFLREKGAAHHPESEMGREIGPNEDQRLTERAVVLKAVA
jgi:hypothetical protein